MPQSHRLQAGFPQITGAEHGHRDMPRFDHQYIEYYDTRRMVTRMSRKQRSDGGADLLDMIDMTEALMEIHQMSFEIDGNYAWKLWFPYMFIKPAIGAELRNLTTGEVYSIAHVEILNPNERRPQFGPLGRSPRRDVFAGSVILTEGQVAPAYAEKLEFVDKETYLIPFFEWGTQRHTKEVHEGGQTEAGEVGRFNPSVTWTVKRVEPGTIGRRPFDPQKMAKPQLRETFPDPQYTYLNWDQRYREAQAIHNLFPTGETIKTGTHSALTRVQADPRGNTHKIEVYGQWFDNLVQYDCWSTSNAEANALIHWLEDFMELYTPVLKQNGVAEMLYWQRMQDQTIERWRNDIDNRTIQYFYRTENLRIRRTRNFRKFDLHLSIKHVNDELAAFHGTGGVGFEPTGVTYYTGQVGYGASQVQRDLTTGVIAGGTGHYTGAGTYLWGELTIQED